MKFDLQRFSDAKIFIRHNLAKYGFTVSDTGVSAPRLAIRHDDRDYYAALTSSADKPRLALYTGGETKYISLSPKGTIVWLPFDESVTADKCGNTWTTYGTPTIEDDTNAISGKSLHLDGSSYLQLDGSVRLGGQDFTVDCWVNMSSDTAKYGRIFDIVSYENAYTLLQITRYDTDLQYGVWNNPSSDCSTESGHNWKKTVNTNVMGTHVHLEADYIYSEQKLLIFINGQLDKTITGCPQYVPSQFKITIGAFKDGTYNMIGTIEHFRICDGIALHTSNFTPPTYWSYFADYLSVWLPFTSSPTEDKCGNTWTAYGSPSIEDDANAISGKSLYLDGSSYLQLNGYIRLGGQDFTVDCWVNMSSDTVSGSRIFDIFPYGDGYSLFQIARRGTQSTYMSVTNTVTDCSLDSAKVIDMDNTVTVGTRIHLEADYIYSQKKLLVFINGQLDQTVTGCPQYLPSQFKIAIGEHHNGKFKMTGMIEHFRVYDGVALHTENFTPPTAADYA